MEKIALCFIINYEHILYKEHLWREWIEHNKDIINVYFFYKDLNKIKSQWIYQHAIPQKKICHTTYYHVIPAYIAILNFALKHDKKNKWFCFLTDSCCPIISPNKFRQHFKIYKNRTIMSYCKASWNINFHQRANLALLPKQYHLKNDPWFVLTRENAVDIMNFVVNETKLCNTICNGGLANESLFAIILTHYNKSQSIISKPSHMADWFRMSSPTSPYMFKEGTQEDIDFIETFLKDNDLVMFIRKVHPKFPDEILRKYIFNENMDDGNHLRFKIIKKIMYNNYFIGIFIMIITIYILFCN
jgi:hypothetical protein